MATTLQFPQQTTTLNQIKPGPFQARHTFIPDKLLGLARSIQSGGLIDPPIVFSENGHFNLLGGERRWRALCALAIAQQLGGLEAAIEAVCQSDAPHWLAQQAALTKATVTPSCSMKPCLSLSSITVWFGAPLP
jgi:hypothetical protein